MTAGGDGADGIGMSSHQFVTNDRVTTVEHVDKPPASGDPRTGAGAPQSPTDSSSTAPDPSTSTSGEPTEPREAPGSPTPPTTTTPAPSTTQGLSSSPQSSTPK